MNSNNKSNKQRVWVRFDGRENSGFLPTLQATTIWVAVATRTESTWGEEQKEHDDDGSGRACSSKDCSWGYTVVVGNDTTAASEATIRRADNNSLFRRGQRRRVVVASASLLRERTFSLKQGSLPSAERCSSLSPSLAPRKRPQSSLATSSVRTSLA